jgi:cation:H+ antiporter
MVLTELAMFVLGCAILIKSADYLVNSLSDIAAYFRVSDFVIGFIVMAFATSIPDLTVGVSSALSSTPSNPLTSMALGDVIGGNILALTLVVGVIAILRKDIKVETKAVRTDTIYMFLIVALPMVLMMDRELSQMDGLILVFVFLVYILRLLGQRSKSRSRGAEEERTEASKKKLQRSIILSLISLFFLFLGASLLVTNGGRMAEYLGVPPILIGLFLISIGTTMPELIFEMKAITSDHQNMALGDLIGSVITNSTLVLGLTAIIFPIQAGDFLVYMTSTFFMLTVAFLFMTFIEAERHILWQEGVGLILLYVLFVIVELSMHQFEVAQALG